MENNYNTENIDAYLANLMDAGQRAEFEDQMAADTNLEQEVKKYALERETVKLLLKEEYRQKVKGWLNEEAKEELATSSTTATGSSNIPQENTPIIKLEPQKEDTAKVVPMKGLRRILSIAASILVLVFAATYYFASGTYSSAAIIDSSYLMADSPGDRSGDTAGSAALIAALQTYFAEDYQSAKTQFAQISINEPDYLAAQYYLGHTSLKLKDYSAASNAFSSLLESTNLPSFINKDKLSYNHLLAMMGEGNTGNRFQEDLQNLIDNGSPSFSQKAQVLKDKTTSFWFKMLQ